MFLKPESLDWFADSRGGIMSSPYSHRASWQIVSCSCMQVPSGYVAPCLLCRSLAGARMTYRLNPVSSVTLPSVSGVSLLREILCIQPQLEWRAATSRRPNVVIKTKQKKHHRIFLAKLIVFWTKLQWDKCKQWSRTEHPPVSINQIFCWLKAPCCCPFHQSRTLLLPAETQVNTFWAQVTD